MNYSRSDHPRAKLMLMARTLLLSLMLILIICQLLLARPTDGQSMQEVYITIGFHNENLQTALRRIERASNFFFSYQTPLVAPYNKLSLPKETRSVFATLQLLLEKTDLGFRQNGNSIILYRLTRGGSISAIESPVTAQAGSDPRPAGVPVDGTVTNSKGEPVQGASIQVRGLSVGTTTDGKGNFSLEVPAGSNEIVVSAVGYSTQSFAVRAGKTIHIILQDAATGLAQVIVVGYGQQKKIDMTGSVVTLDASQIESRAAANVSSVLAGQAPGLTVIQQGGAPGRDAGALYVHGIGTLGNASPLIVVDGIKTDSYTQIDPNDIASISILKDAASSAIYGIDAANGVIIITTKRGKKGKLKVNYNFQYGGSAFQKLPVKVNSWQLAAMYDSAQSDDGTPSSSFKFTNQDVQEFRDGSDPSTHANSNWTKAIFSKPGTWDSHNLILSGGTDDTRYNISFGYLDDAGIMESTGLQKYTFRTNFDQKISEKLSGGFNIAFTQSNIIDPPTVLGVGERPGISMRLCSNGRMTLFTPVTEPMLIRSGPG